MEEVIREVTLGSATWQSVGNVLKGELDSLEVAHPSEGDEVLGKLIGDFLGELDRRRLWKPEGGLDS